MRRRWKWWLGMLAVLLLLAGGLAWLQPPAIRLSDRYSAAERREILVAARRSALRGLMGAVRQGQFQYLWRWASRNPTQTFHVVGDSGPDQLWLICGNPDLNSPQGYVVWSTAVLTRKAGHWRTEWE